MAARPVSDREDRRNTRKQGQAEEERRRRDRETIVRALEASGGKVFGAGGAAELLEAAGATHG